MWCVLLDAVGFDGSRREDEEIAVYYFILKAGMAREGAVYVFAPIITELSLI